MRRDSSLTEQQRATAITLFETGYGRDAVATQLGVSRDVIKGLHDRWRVRGGGALVTKSTKRTFSFELKLEIVHRFLAGETKVALAQEFNLSSPQLIGAWARTYRNEGEDALRPKPKGRPRKPADDPGREETELERLRRENEYLRAEVAYLGKLRALIVDKRR